MFFSGDSIPLIIGGCKNKEILINLLEKDLGELPKGFRRIATCYYNSPKNKVKYFLRCPYEKQRVEGFLCQQRK